MYPDIQAKSRKVDLPFLAVMVEMVAGSGKNLVASGESWTKVWGVGIVPFADGCNLSATEEKDLSVKPEGESACRVLHWGSRFLPS